MNASGFLTDWDSTAASSEAPPIPGEGISPRGIEAGVRALHGLLGEMGHGTESIVQSEGAVWYTSPGLSLRDVRAAIIGLAIDSGDEYRVFASIVAERAREALCYCILPNSQVSIWPSPMLARQLGAASVIPIYRSDLDAIAAGNARLSDLTEYKVYRRIVLEKPDTANRYSRELLKEFLETLTRPGRGRLQPIQEVLSGLAEGPADWVEHPWTPRILRSLELGRGCLLVGASSSGKSVLCFQIALQRALAGATVQYVNLGAIHTEPLGLLSEFLAGDGERPDLIIVDDLQSSPSTARYLLAVGNALRRAGVPSNLPILASSWPDFALDASSWHEQCLPCTVQSSQVRDAILRQYAIGLATDVTKAIAEQFGDDLTLLRLALQQAQQTGSRPLLSSVAETLWTQRTSGSSVSSDDAVKTALVAGALGRYDISAPSRFLAHEARVDAQILEQLVRSRLLRRHRELVSMGHRSFCALVADWLSWRGGWTLLAHEGGPGDTPSVVLDYLRALGSSLTVDSLRALHARAGLKDRPLLNRRAQAVVEVWQAFDAIVERIEKQQRKDPTWNAVPSSAMFAVQALAEVGKSDLILKGLEFLRQHWALTGGRLRINTEGLNTQRDFEGIALAMRDEDMRTRPEVAGWSPAHEIDFSRFHSTWLTGVFLTAEAAGQQAPPDLAGLAAAVEADQLESGAFYPERVAWSTARVLLGLAACGRNIHTSRPVALAVDWLLREHTKGGALRDGLWASGTGTWNSTLETTAMVLVAISAAGLDVSDRRIAAAKGFVASERTRWTAPGNELDGALSLQAFLDTGGAWSDVAQEAHRLSQWARGAALWEGATATEAVQQLEQTCKVAQIASNLVSIGWTAIRADLPAFLDALSTPFRHDEEIALSPTEALTTTPASSATLVDDSIQLNSLEPSHDPILSCLELMSSLVVNRYVVVGQYTRFDDRTRNQLRDWCHRLSEPLKTWTNAHENFLIWAAPGTGKTFLIQQLGESLGPAFRYLELNLAALPRQEISAGLYSITDDGRPTLCLLDEIDSREDEEWPYDDIFPFLDLNRKSSQRIVFVLIGTKADGLTGMIARMRERSKGKDLVDRIPADRRFEIPPPSLEDRAMVVLGQITEAARLRGTRVVEVEKMLLYYGLANEDLQSPRQLSNLARDAVRRLAASDDRLRYDNLFEPGNTRNQRFFAEHLDAAGKLAGVFVRIES